MKIYRMRTIVEAIYLIKAQDPDTAVVPYTIRMLAKTKQIRSCYTGTKLLINFDDLLELIGDDDQDSEKELIDSD